jgi:hypothetical protein
MIAEERKRTRIIRNREKSPVQIANRRIIEL